MTPIEDDEDVPLNLQEALLFYPAGMEEFPLNFQNIANEQQNDTTLLPLADKDDFEIQTFNGIELIACQHNGFWQIVVPQVLVDPTINWYHVVLGHCGVTRLIKSLSAHVWFPNMKSRVETLVEACNHCQRYKFAGPGYGHLPPRNDVASPWEEVAVDLIGPWTINLPEGNLSLRALTMIDTTTTLTECVRIDNKTAAHVAMHFTNQWLSRYPRPLRCVHDQGTEFIGIAFQTMLVTNDITAVPTTVRNPQSNAICERMHKTVQDMLNTFL
eukprot:scaffold1513_cov100-Amphora_coffeaeformis.AAC.35